MQTITLKLPEHWANYLFNCDSSDLSDDELRDIEQCLQFYINSELIFSNPVGCTTESEFTRFYDWNGLACNCLEYTFQIRPEGSL